MLIKLDKARVTSPTHRYEKARATITVDELAEQATLAVIDRRTGHELAAITGPLTEVDRTYWTVGDWRVERLGGCGCGGTTTTPL